ncbi:MAG: ribonuclease P protein component [Provencibacterium sp.]|jgi:ribonuclease P protein component|nr:ribonuclease P protein component [Provencibacterium sp.]
MQTQPHAQETLNRNHQFRLIYKKGKSKVHPLLVTYAMRNRTGTARLAVVSSKKIGNAVNRNRARRVVRAAYRESGFAVPAGWDVVFVCRTKTAFVKSTVLVPVMMKQLNELMVQRPGLRG